jgi:hypothetical protein
LARLGGTRDQTRATDETSNEPVNRWVKPTKKNPWDFSLKKKKALGQQRSLETAVSVRHHPHFFFGTLNPNAALFSSHVHRHAGAFVSRACASHRAGCTNASGASHAGTQFDDRLSVVPHAPRDPSIGAAMLTQ